MTESMLPTTSLAKALASSKGLLTQDDYADTQKEEAKILFAGVRQKDIKDARGQIVRPAGAFSFGNKDDLTYDDRPELMLTILGFAPGRTFFKDLNETKPTCQSNDMKNGSAPRETIGGRPVFGDCATCHYNEWGSALVGRGKRCRENRRLFCMDWSRGGPIILTIGVSSLRAWAAYDDAVRSDARQAFGEDENGNIPFVHHLLQVKATLEYKAEPSGHYVVQWRDRQALPLAIQERIASERIASLARFRETSARTEYDPEDVAVGAPQGDAYEPE